MLNIPILLLPQLKIYVDMLCYFSYSIQFSNYWQELTNFSRPVCVSVYPNLPNHSAATADVDFFQFCFIKITTLSNFSLKNKQYTWMYLRVCLPQRLSGKQYTCNADDAGLIPGSGRPLGGGNSNPLQYSCLEIPMDRGAWQATVHGVARVGCDSACTHTCKHTQVCCVLRLQPPKWNYQMRAQIILVLSKHTKIIYF